MPNNRIVRAMGRISLAVIVVVLAGCSSVNPEDVRLRVLFVGNSLTYENDLPAAVAALAEADGRPIAYKMVAHGNAALMDHWLGNARDALDDGIWDVVVLQQGPSSLPENQENLRTWTMRWADEARENGTIPALYMVWPAESRRGDFPGVIQSYTNAAAAADAQLYPAGSAWLLVLQRSPGIPLYGPDGFHPSETGTYLAALVVYGGITGASLVGLPSRLDLPNGSISMSESRARMLQETAAEALADVDVAF